MISSLMLALFLGLILLINSRQLGVSSLNGYATANHSIGVLGITFGFLATSYSNPPKKTNTTAIMMIARCLFQYHYF